MDILKFIFIILEVLVLFNVIIIVHELGHFLAARWRGLVVERFSVWFGKPIWEREYNGVKYSLGCIPAGGFVALPQMAPMEFLEGETEHDRSELKQASVMDRIIVAFAGPLFSFLLAILFAVCIWQIGRPVSESELTTVVGYVGEDTPAERVGIQPGDEILEVDGFPVETFTGVGDSITWRIVSSVGETVPIKINRDGTEMILDAEPEIEETQWNERGGLRKLGIGPQMTPVVGQLIQNGPGEVAGLQINDVILSLNGKTVYSPFALDSFIAENGMQPMNLTVERGDEILNVQLTPALPSNRPDQTEPEYGILWDNAGQVKLAHPGPMEQIRDSVNTMISTLSAIFTRDSDIDAQHLAGPAGIMRMYYLLFQSENGWRLAIWFSVIFNVNLAILNMLPIPVLDGGHITMALYEGITRRKINVSLLQTIQTGCALALIGFMLYVTFFDVQDIGSSITREEEAPVEFAVPENVQSAEPAED